jgi:hypothetical protein
VVDTRLIPSSFKSASPPNGTPVDRRGVGTISLSTEGGISRLDITVTISLYPPAVAVDPPAEPAPALTRNQKRNRKRAQQRARTAAAQVAQDVAETTTVGMALGKAFAENGVEEVTT